MENDPIKKAWKATPANQGNDAEKIQSIEALDGQVSRIKGNIRSRDRLEIIAAILSMVYFSFSLYYSTNPWKSVGASILIAYSILVIYMLNSVKKYAQSFDPLCTIKEQLIHMRTYLDQERRLLDHVFYWYLLPPFIGLTLITIGQNFSWLGMIVFLVLLGGLYLFIYRLNKKAVKHKFIPLIQELDRAIQELDPPA